jgi:hypothetical protein
MNRVRPPPVSPQHTEAPEHITLKEFLAWLTEL